MPPAASPAAPRPVLVFDGDCGFCTTSARVVTDVLRRAPDDFAVVPWQHLDLPALGLTQEQCLEALQWVGADGRTSAGHLGVARVLLASRWWARPAGAVLLLPGVRWLGGVVYRAVARNRYRLPGGSPACAVPSPPPST